MQCPGHTGQAADLNVQGQLIGRRPKRIAGIVVYLTTGLASIQIEFTTQSTRTLPIGLEDAAFDRLHYKIQVAVLELHN